jgi:response regulator of citrate/malate metabolism
MPCRATASNVWSPGMNDYIIKPIRREELETTLNRCQTTRPA